MQKKEISSAGRKARVAICALTGALSLALFATPVLAVAEPTDEVVLAAAATIEELECPDVVYPGKSYPLQIHVGGDFVEPPLWDVQFKRSRSTFISNDGVLYISKDETAPQLYIKVQVEDELGNESSPYTKWIDVCYVSGKINNLPSTFNTGEDYQLDVTHNGVDYRIEIYGNEDSETELLQDENGDYTLHIGSEETAKELSVSLHVNDSFDSEFLMESCTVPVVYVEPYAEFVNYPTEVLLGDGNIPFEAAGNTKFYRMQINGQHSADTYFDNSTNSLFIGEDETAEQIELLLWVQSPTGQQISDRINVAISPERHQHKLIEAISSVSATASKQGTKAVYQCEDCTRYFSDEAASNEVKDVDSWLASEGVIPRIGTVKLSVSSAVYNGKVKAPTVIVSDENNNAIDKANYTVTTPTGRKNVGKYTYKVTFEGDYSGSKSLNFTINPTATSIGKLVSGRKAFTVKWTRKTSQVTGYQIQYGTSSTFKSAKTITVSSYKTYYKAIKSLKAKKRYYVRIRTYKVANGTKYYSAWSAKKYVTTK